LRRATLESVTLAEEGTLSLTRPARITRMPSFDTDCDGIPGDSEGNLDLNKY
jgi:hypothetical protein